MNLEKIRKMSDEQLTRFINDISQRSSIICSKCGGIIISKERKCLMISINNKGIQKTKKLCNLCSDCYIDLLDYIGISDVEW